MRFELVGRSWEGDAGDGEGEPYDGEVGSFDMASDEGSM